LTLTLEGDNFEINKESQNNDGFSVPLQVDIGGQVPPGDLGVNQGKCDMPLI